MEITYSVSGYCPVLNRDWEIDVFYIPYSKGMENGETEFKKSRMKCEHSKYLGNCNIECPLKKLAPETFK